MSRPSMKATQTDRAVVYETSHGDKARVRAWMNSGVLTIEVSADEDHAVAVEVNGKEVYGANANSWEVPTS